MKVGYLLISVLTFLLGVFAAGSRVITETSDAPERPPASLTPTEIGMSMKAPSVANHKDGYVGCWTGMHGGRLKITRNKVYDLGSEESAPITNVSTPYRADPEGLQTGEMYVIDTGTEFPKSFLSKIIELSFNSEGTVGITAYDSYDDYSKDRFSGMGLFEKVDCAELNNQPDTGMGFE